MEEVLIPEDPKVTRILDVIHSGKSGGFFGFGGECGAAAIAINRVLFEGKAELVGAFNAAFYEKGHWIGHVAVRVDHPEYGMFYLDGDATVKDISEIDSWGMLDTEDSDYAEQADDLNIAWNDDTAYDVCTVVLTEEQIAQNFSCERLAHLVEILEHARHMHDLGLSNQPVKKAMAP